MENAQNYRELNLSKKQKRKESIYIYIILPGGDEATLDNPIP